MPTTITLWRIDDDGSAIEVIPGQLDLEDQIEDAIEAAPKILGTQVLIVGRQVQTPSGPLDLLAIDEDRRLVVIENKRDRTAREATAQVIDYASWTNTLELEDIEEIYLDYCTNRLGDEDRSLAASFRDCFESDIDSLTLPPQMIIVASRLDDATERMIEFLADSFGVSINAVLFQPFHFATPIEGTIIGQTWLRPEERSTTSRQQKTTKAREFRAFWEQWFGVARSTLPELRLDYVGTSPYISRRVEPGIPASILIWVAKSTAYAQLRFDDMTEPRLNTAMLEAISENRTSIDAKFDGTLVWEENPNLKSTCISTPIVDIGSLTEPSKQSLDLLTDYTRMLYDAVSDQIRSAFDRGREKLQKIISEESGALEEESSTLD